MVPAHVPALVRAATTAAKAKIPFAALVPVLAVGLVFVAYCWYDIIKGPVRYLPKAAWMLISIISVPIGGIVYLLVGRDR